MSEWCIASHSVLQLLEHGYHAVQSPRLQRCQTAASILHEPCSQVLLHAYQRDLFAAVLIVGQLPADAMQADTSLCVATKNARGALSTLSAGLSALCIGLPQVHGCTAQLRP